MSTLKPENFGELELRLGHFLESENVRNVRLTDYLKALSVFEETKKYATRMETKKELHDIKLLKMKSEP